MLRYLNLKKNKSAFLLLEVVLSVFIVTVGIVFVIGSFITSIKTFKVSKIYLDALYLTEDKMWEYEVNGEIEEDKDSGKFEDYKNAKWNVEAELLEDEDLNLNETTLEVELKEGDRKKRRFEVATYFFNKED
jgi:hypothetical protein